MVDLDKIKELVQLMVDNDLIELSLRDGGEEVNLKRPNNSAPITAVPMHAVPTLPVTGLPDTALPATEAAPAAEPAKEQEELVPIRSPMVGTFYRSPNPESSPYVDTGTQISADSVVCIVEAMKVFNEIKAEVDGTIEKILVKNEQAVEYGQPMFLVRPR